MIVCELKTEKVECEMGESERYCSGAGNGGFSVGAGCVGVGPVIRVAWPGSAY